MRVALFIPCITDQFFPEVGIATARILRKFGATVDYPKDQTCCGQPAFNSGYHDDARVLAERFLKIFSSSQYIVAPSGSCVSMVKVFYDYLELPGELSQSLLETKEKIFELSDFLVRILQVEKTGASFPHTVTYHDSCHLLRELQVAEAPRRLIRNVDAIEFKELNDSDRCCGFGGTFAVKFPEISVAMGEYKIKNIEESGVEYVVANDSSCLLHMEGIMRQRRMAARTMHIAELLVQGW
jgi:L-lactate dehydrogenase complex protein LldE